MPDLCVAAKLRRRLPVAIFGTVTALAVAGCAAPATKTADPARVARLGALFVQAMPIGWIAERIAVRYPNWPLQDRAGRVTPAQLACTRAELTPDKLNTTLVESAKVFARRYPERVEESIELLENGAAETSGMLVRGGALEGIGAGKFNAERLMAQRSAGQLRSFIVLSQDTQYAELRHAMRLSGILEADNSRESRQRGFRLGQSLMVAPLLSALERCNIAPAAIFDKSGMPA